MDREHELCAEIGQEYPPCGFYIDDGWFPVVADALRRIAEAAKPFKWQLAQVKEKFCQLRIYFEFEEQIWKDDHPSHAAYERVVEIYREAAAKCNEMCQLCGAPHGLRTPRSGMALCEPCDKKRDAELRDKLGY